MSAVFQSKDQRDVFLTLLKVMGGRTAEVWFDGSGDSGSIEGARLVGQEGKEIDLTNATFDWHEQKGEFDKEKNQWVKKYAPAPAKPVHDILVQICEEALEDTGHDWYNNDGGYGQLVIDLTTTPPEVKLEVHIRYTSTEDYEYDLNDTELEEAEEQLREETK
jgi:hypothetical protein